MKINALRTCLRERPARRHATVKETKRRLDEVHDVRCEARPHLIGIVNRKPNVTHKTGRLQRRHRLNDRRITRRSRHMADVGVEIIAPEALERHFRRRPQPHRIIRDSGSREDARAELRYHLNRLAWQRLARKELAHDLFRRTVRRRRVNRVHAVLRGVVQHPNRILDGRARSALHTIVHAELNCSNAKSHHFSAKVLIKLANVFAHALRSFSEMTGPHGILAHPTSMPRASMKAFQHDQFGQESNKSMT